MNSFKSNKSALMAAVLALGGLVALAAPASADDYDNHGANTSVGAVWAPSGVRVVNAPLVGSYDDNHGNNTVVVSDRANVQSKSVTVADRAARRAQDDFKYLQQ